MYRRSKASPHGLVKLTCASLAMFLHTYAGLPSGELRCVSTAVMSSHVAEHSMSTTTPPSLPDDVPVTLMSTVDEDKRLDGRQAEEGAEIERAHNERRK